MKIYLISGSIRLYTENVGITILNDLSYIKEYRKLYFKDIRYTNMKNGIYFGVLTKTKKCAKIKK